jgi:hypothetical protein
MVWGENIASEHIAVLQVENVLIKVEPTLIHVGPVVRVLNGKSSSNNPKLLHSYPVTRLSKPLIGLHSQTLLGLLSCVEQLEVDIERQDLLWRAGCLC